MKPLIGIILMACIVSMLECLLWQGGFTWIAFIVQSVVVVGVFYWIGEKK